jgi:hypothetical protein
MEPNLGFSVSHSDETGEINWESNYLEQLFMQINEKVVETIFCKLIFTALH